MLTYILSVTIVIPPLIVHLLDIQATTNASIKSLHLNRYKLCMMFLRELSDTYCHATFYCELFDLAASIGTKDSCSGTQSVQDALINFMRQHMGSSNSPHYGSSSSTKIVAETPRNTNGLLLQGDQHQIPEVNSFEQGQTHASNESETDDVRDHLVLSDGTVTDSGDAAGDWGYIDSEVPELSTNADQQFEYWLGAQGTFQNLFPSA